MSEQRNGGGGRSGGGRPKSRGFFPRGGRRREDEFAKLGIVPDYKDVSRLHRYITAQGKILPRRRSGLSAKNQRRLTIAIKHARHMSLLPYVSDRA